MPDSHWPAGPSPWIMGILNVTPDSFSDGGQYIDPVHAIEQARRMTEEGADIIDIGGESTRPGAHPVPTEAQIERVVPVIRAIRRFWDGPISIDTTRAQAAEAALDAGANWINDISALRDDPATAVLAARRGCPIVLMHMLGTPRDMQSAPRYDDVVEEVCSFLAERARAAEANGIARDRIILDPGIGFGKTLEHNLALLRHLPRLTFLGYPVLIGASRKSFIGHLTGAAVGNRLPGSLAAALAAVDAGAAIVRVHDVAATRQALTVHAALRPR